MSEFDSVVAVGETVLSKGGDGKRGYSETVWPDSNKGGCYKAVRRPPWQHDRYCEHRLANDVANALSVAEYDSYDYGGWINRRQCVTRAVSSRRLWFGWKCKAARRRPDLLAAVTPKASISRDRRQWRVRLC
jgi:hypothetical protein